VRRRDDLIAGETLNVRARDRMPRGRRVARKVARTLGGGALPSARARARIFLSSSGVLLHAQTPSLLLVSGLPLFSRKLVFVAISNATLPRTNAPSRSVRQCLDNYNLSLSLSFRAYAFPSFL